MYSNANRKNSINAYPDKTLAFMIIMKQKNRGLLKYQNAIYLNLNS